MQSSERGLLCDFQIRRLCTRLPSMGGWPEGEGPMIDPFEPVQVTKRVVPGLDSAVDALRKPVEFPVISYGLSSYGYDMRAGTKWKLFTDVRGSYIDPKHPTEECFHDLEVAVGERVVLPPNSYALTHSIERLRMPKNVLGLCIGKSTYARVGVHVNVTPLEPGWEGQVTIEIANSTRLPVVVYAGEGIMQVLFFAGEVPDTDYGSRQGKYQGQEGVTPARMR